jgi:hypothetical protein
MRCAARVVGAIGAILLLALVLPRGAAAETALGKQRVLAVLITFDGTRLAPRADVTDAFAQAGAFFSRSSFGRMTLVTTVTPWLGGGLIEPSCDAAPDQMFTPLRALAATGGYRTTAYDRVMYIVEGPDCGFHGIEFGPEVLIVHEPDARLIVHELGHTFGLPHAGASAVCGTWCVTQEQGDLYSPMGEGFSDFSAYEKEQLGWIPRQPRIARAGHYVVYPRSGRIVGRQALVIDAPGGEYWLEQRPERTAPALIVRIVQPETAFRSFVSPSTLLLAPVRTGHPTVLPGQTFRVPGEFAVTVGRAARAPMMLNVSLASTRQ